MARLAAGLWVVLSMAACGSLPTHPSLQVQARSSEGLPPLIPLRLFVADWDATGAHQISPDGRRLLWQGRLGLGPGLFVQDLDTGAVRRYAVRGLGQWARDSRHVLLHMDASGDENTHVFELDAAVEGAQPRDLTPFRGARSLIHAQLPDSDDLLIQSNRRDPKVFDLYRWKRADNQLQLVLRNPGNVAQWVTDTQGQVVGRGARDGDHWVFEQRADDQPEGIWKGRFRIGLFDSLQPLLLPAGEGFAWALSNRGRDKLALVKLRLADGHEEVVFADSRVDVSEVLFSRRTQAPLAVSLNPDVQVWQALDPAFASALQRLNPAGSGQRLLFMGSSDDEDRLLAQITRPDGAQTVLLQRSTGTLRVLAEQTRSRLHAESPLGTTRPLQINARDGLPLHGYLTLPAGVAARQLPTIVLVHGGPWARDVHLSTDPLVPFLANRGYAVLQVNYRGSSGYGRAFTEAAQHEFAGRMHTDLLDMLDEVVRQGIADPQRVAIAGASYGGYASLVGMTHTPGRFACAISIVGMSDLASLITNAPPYWELGRFMWLRQVGDPQVPAERRRMDAQSPLLRAADVRGPILLMHGRHDPRVRLDQSERMAQALQAAGKPVELHVFDHAGHGFFRWQDRLRQYRLSERFLAGCLGGRDGGFDAFEIGAWLL